jgi:hypothetical protein
MGESVAGKAPWQRGNQDGDSDGLDAARRRAMHLHETRLCSKHRSGRIVIFSALTESLGSGFFFWNPVYIPLQSSDKARSLV